jgi:hypothetical protein
MATLFPDRDFHVGGDEIACRAQELDPKYMRRPYDGIPSPT